MRIFCLSLLVAIVATMSAPLPTIGHIAWQLDQVRSLMGSGCWAKQLFYGVTAATTAPQSCWIDYVNAAYDRGLKPVIRLAGTVPCWTWTICIR